MTPAGIETTPVIYQNDDIADHARDSYSSGALDALEELLWKRGTFQFPVTRQGLFPAAAVDASTRYTRYDKVWLRDNVYVIYAHWLAGRRGPAVRATQALMDFVAGQRLRFDRIIRGETDPRDRANRPHVRFSGATLGELKQRWSHAENDALGYFLWLSCRLAREGLIDVRALGRELDTLSMFPRYFERIQYWQDRDSGHWEETPKVSASSIGVVVGGLREYRLLVGHLRQTGHVGKSWAQGEFALCEAMIHEGREALADILPAECVENDPSRSRRYDAALLFLVFPMEVVEEEMASRILSDVTSYLQGEYGIRRYLGDSYWCPNYKKKVPPAKRTANYADDLSWRDALGEEGKEAQWCIFDPIVSAIYGRRYQRNGRREDLARQVLYLNRSLGKITGKENPFGAFKCPELYYLENGRWVANDATPLLWTQANLLVAMRIMRESLQHPTKPR